MIGLVLSHLQFINICGDASSFEGLLYLYFGQQPNTGVVKPPPVVSKI